MRKYTYEKKHLHNPHYDMYVCICKYSFVFYYHRAKNESLLNWITCTMNCIALFYKRHFVKLLRKSVNYKLQHIPTAIHISMHMLHMVCTRICTMHIHLMQLFRYSLKFALRKLVERNLGSCSEWVRVGSVRWA